MDKRTTAIVATVVTALLCGCPGLAILCLGVFAVPYSITSGNPTGISGVENPHTLLNWGIVGLCLGILLIAIPVVVGFTMLRNRPAAADMVVPPAAPMPPTDFVAPPAPPIEPESGASPSMGTQVEPPAESPAEEPAEPSAEPPAPPEEPQSGAGPSMGTQVEPPAESPAEKPAEPPASEKDDDIPPAI